MTSTNRLILALAAALLLAACNRAKGVQAQGAPPPDAGAAQPAASEDRNMAACAELGVDPAAHIAACTAVIDSSAASPHDRATALNNRGVTRSQQGDLEAAIADYTAAIALNPRYDFAFYNRAKAWRDKGETAKADADAAEAVRINPAFKGR